MMENTEQDIKKQKELTHYKNSLLGLRGQNLDYTIGNKNADHAAISSSVIFTGTKKEVKIYSGSLNSNVADNDEFVSGLISIISKDIKISLIMDNYDPKNISKGLRVLFTFVENKDNISIKQLNKEILPILKKKGLSNHFIISDDKMLREETCPEKYEATVNFHTTESDKFNTIFQLLNEYSKDITVPSNL